MQPVRTLSSQPKESVANYTIDNTNSKHLELYSILGEYDNAGFPLSYCLLSTANAVEIGKRTRALQAWAQALRDKYGVIPVFVHVDKDMAEIGMSKHVWWESKIQLCWWHMRKAVRERLAKSKLSTSPYNPKRAKQEFTFIDLTFIPPGSADPDEHEGGARAPSPDPPDIRPPRPHALILRIPNPSQPPSALDVPDTSHPTPEVLQDAVNTIPADPTMPTVLQPVQPGQENEADKENPKLKFRIPVKTSNPVVESGHSRESGKERRTFCPAEHREVIVDMMEQHLCAHPLIPGYAHPSPVGIREWAVRQMYEFCHKHDLREAWAYLWENWYRPGRWELWARTVHAEIPVLKTTMILESQ
jgi:hypothetical protein